VVVLVVEIAKECRMQQEAQWLKRFEYCQAQGLADDLKTWRSRRIASQLGTSLLIVAMPTLSRHQPRRPPHHLPRASA
jgi:hypothetical protein